MACEVTLNTAVLEDGTLDVVSKFRTLTTEALGTDSIYMRAKDTFKELFDGKKISEAEYAQLASSFVSQLAVATTQQVMQGALTWAQAESDNPYTQAKAKADTDLTLAQQEQTKYAICKLDKEIALHCAQIEATIASSIRENGRVSEYDGSGCKPLALHDEGVKFDQKAVYQAQTYTALADAYRKSGVVSIDTTTDGVTKGTAGDSAGYTDAQDKYARRQILSFEDSKRSHAVNALSQTIGQLLATDIVPDQGTIINKFNAAIDYLNSNTPAV